MHTTAAPRLTVLNDTDTEGRHFGCSRVMSNINALSRQSGLKLCATVPAATASTSPRMRRAIRDADVILINGEGTLHHGRRRARWLIEAIEYAKSRGKAVALVNALYQDNPASWNHVVEKLDLVCARDSLSAMQLSAATGRTVNYAGDLALYSDTLPLPRHERAGVLFGDSVYGRVTRQLVAAAENLARLVPTRVTPVTNYYRLPRSSYSTLVKLKAWYAYRCYRSATSRRKIVSFACCQQCYMDKLRQCTLSVTGRFHAVCFAVLTRTPFIAVRSNSWKIDAMIDDVGLNRDRLVAPEALSPEFILRHDWSYSARELSAIEQFLEINRRKMVNLFNSLGSLAERAPA